MLRTLLLDPEAACRCLCQCCPETFIELNYNYFEPLIVLSTSPFRSSQPNTQQCDKYTLHWSLSLINSQLPWTSFQEIISAFLRHEYLSPDGCSIPLGVQYKLIFIDICHVNFPLFMDVEPKHWLLELPSELLWLKLGQCQDAMLIACHV